MDWRFAVFGAGGGEFFTRHRLEGSKDEAGGGESGCSEEMNGGRTLGLNTKLGRSWIDERASGRVNALDPSSRSLLQAETIFGVRSVPRPRDSHGCFPLLAVG